MRKAKIDPLVNNLWHGHSLGASAHTRCHTLDSEDLREASELLQTSRKAQKANKVLTKKVGSKNEAR